jgi:cobalt/nickel transport system permease protein
MATGHVHALYHHGSSPLHRMQPQVKIAATLMFVVAIVMTPREAFWCFAAHAAVVLGLVVLARLPIGFFARRLLIEVPFLLFAVFLPFVGGGERIDVAFLSLSRDGLWAAWNILAKAPLGASASIVLAATTEIPDILTGLSRLRAPRAIVSIMGFMVRYLEVVIGDLSRMRVALQSRGYAPRRIREAGALAATAGTLFIRSYERGERVYLAMVARGYSGTMPDVDHSHAGAVQWGSAALLVTVAAAVAAAGWMLR